MRIAIAMPQVPFVRGGAEILTDTLAAELRARGHEVDTILIPYKWYPPERLVLDSLVWRQMDLTEANGEKIDLLLCTKYPSYLARHPNKRLWLYHQHRYVYDLFDTPGGEYRYDAEGTDIRAAVSELDRLALAECRVTRTISKNVAARLLQYSGISASELYPPPRGLANFHAGPYGNYVLYVGRLETIKRVDMLVRAAARLLPGYSVKIAGRGPALDSLRRLARDAGVESRVEFLGFVAEADLYRLYAEARAVYYAPVDEDYGFTTVEGFLSGKPVVTFLDAGGVLEFVSPGETGLCSAPDVAALSANLNELLADTALARRLGEAGRERVRGISWEPVLDSLLG